MRARAPPGVSGPQQLAYSAYRRIGSAYRATKYVPRTAFQDTPNLEMLDLEHNRIDALPEYALHHLPKLTYFDLSFSPLTVVSRDVLLI